MPLLQFFFNKDLDETPDTTFRLWKRKGKNYISNASTGQALNPFNKDNFFEATFALTFHKNIQSQIYKFSSRVENILQEKDHVIVRTTLPVRLDKVELRKDIVSDWPENTVLCCRAWKAGMITGSNGSFDPTLTTQPTLFEMTPGKDCMVMLHISPPEDLKSHFHHTAFQKQQLI